MSEKVSVVTVNYNGRKYLEEFFDSVIEQEYDNIELIVVDNSSVDDSVEWIKSGQYPLHLIELETNEGFGGGSNIGISYAISNGAKYVLLLNTDTVLEKNLVGELVKYADESTVTTALTYCGKDGERRPWYAGGKIDPVTANVDQLLYEKDSECLCREVDFVSGCCMMIHKNIFEKVGYFDRDFYLYYEDTDFCVRLKKNNIVMKYISTTSLWHKVGGSSVGGDEMSCSTQYYTIRNRLLFADKYPELFPGGNLGILREILAERNFFEGSNNEKYEIYIKAAINDFMKKYFGRGYYGKRLLEEYYYVEDGFYEREEDDEKSWYCAGDVQADVYIVNPRKKSVLYKVLFDVAKERHKEDEKLLIELDNEEVGMYSFDRHVEFMTFVSGEQKKKLHFTLHGESVCSFERTDGGQVYFQLLNLQVKEINSLFYLDFCFLPEETDGKTRWFWSTKKKASVFLINEEDEIRIYKIRFNITAYRYGKNKSAHVFQDEQMIAEIEAEKERILWVAVNPRTTSVLTIKTDFPVCLNGERKLCFCLNDLSVGISDKQFYFGSDVYEEESDGKNSWNWCAGQKADIFLVNNKKECCIKEVTFKISSYKRLKDAEVQVVKGKEALVKIPLETEQSIKVLVLPGETTRLSIQTDIPICDDGKRRVCFRIDDFLIRDTDEAFYYGSGFCGRESDGISSWNWSSVPQADVYFINDKDEVTIRNIAFNVSSYQNRKDIEVKLIRGKETIAEMGLNERRNIRLFMMPYETVRLSVRADIPVYDDGRRKVCFRIDNLSSETENENFYLENNFWPVESDGLNTWQWCSEPSGRISIINRLNEAVVKNVRFKVIPFQSRPENEVKIYFQKEKIRSAQTEEDIQLMLELKPQSISEVAIETNCDIIKDGDREVCFNLYALMISDAAAGIELDRVFYQKEMDEIDSWYWSSERNAGMNIVLGEAAEARISFKVLSEPCYMEEDIEIFVDGRNVGKYGYDETINCVVVKQKNIAIHRMQIKVAHMPYKVENDSRQFAFRICNLKFEEKTACNSLEDKA